MKTVFWGAFGVLRLVGICASNYNTLFSARLQLHSRRFAMYKTSLERFKSSQKFTLYCIAEKSVGNSVLVDRLLMFSRRRQCVHIKKVTQNSFRNSH